MQSHTSGLFLMTDTFLGQSLRPGGAIPQEWAKHDTMDEDSQR
jgi:hypothetical protein